MSENLSDIPRVRPLSREEVRALDVEAATRLKLPTLLLMENAGMGAARILAQRTAPGSRILIACGPGNNGGDGAVVARVLDGWGYRVHVAWLVAPGRLVGDPAVHHAILERSAIDQQFLEPDAGLATFANRLAEADWIVDGLLGTGLTRDVEGPLRSVIEAINASGKPVLALDLPSGLDADTGLPRGIAVTATCTATFVAPKLGFLQPAAARFTGDVEVVSIGLPRCLLEPYFESARSEPAR